MFLLVVSSAPAYSGIYTWVDEKGVVRYSDTPPASDSRGVIGGANYQVPIYHISNTPDPDFDGLYKPMAPDRNGLPRYEKEWRAGQKKKLPRMRLYVEEKKRGWQWCLSKDYTTKYRSNTVEEGTPPHRITASDLSREDLFYWRATAGNSVADLQVVEKKVSMDQKRLPYEYIYDVNDIARGSHEWMHKSYRVTGLPDIKLNGIYHPVTWTRHLPRYKQSGSLCLEARDTGDSWVWNMGKCNRFSYSSDPVAKGTGPSEVSLWYHHGGLQYRTLHIIELQK